MRRLGRTRSEIGPVTPKDGHAERLRPPRIGALFSAFLLLVAVGVLLAVPSALSDIGPPTISSDQADYAPGATVTLTGSNWQPGEAVHISVNDSIGQTWSYGADVTADAGGGYTNQFQLPSSFVASYLVTATGLLSGTATATFSDSAASLDQCTNGGVGDTPEPCVNDSSVSPALSNYENGNSNGSKSHWSEDEFLPYRATIDGVTAGPHTLSITYDTVHSGGHAIDYLGSFDATETTSATATTLHANNNNPCLDVLTGSLASECTPGSPAGSLHIPDATLVNCGGSAGTAPNMVSGGDSDRRMKIWGPAGTTITAMSYVDQNVLQGTGQCSTTLKISFSIGGSASSNDVVLAWAGHIARGAGFNGWGDGDGAGGISGSPYHMAFDTDTNNPDKGLDGASQGAQDRALEAKPPQGAIIPGSTITIIKNTVGGDDTFGYTTTGGGGLPPSFNITTSGGTGQAVNNGVNPGSYTIDETTIPGGWSFKPPLSCSTTGGATAAPDATTNTQADITIPIAGGASVTCTYTNTAKGSIELRKVWSGTPGQTTLNIGSSIGGHEVDQQQTGAAGAQPLSTGANPVDTGTYYVSESGGLANYDSSLACFNDNGAGAGGIAGDGIKQAGEPLVNPDANNGVSVGKSDTVVCTFTNTRQRGSIELRKVWSGTPGQTTLNIGSSIGGHEVDQQQTGAAGAQPLSTGANPVDTGTYYVSESGGLANYDSSLACFNDNGAGAGGIAGDGIKQAGEPLVNPDANNGVSVGKSDTVVCTFTNTRQRGSIELRKVWVGTRSSVDLNIGTTIGGHEIDQEPNLTTDGSTGQNAVDTNTYYLSEVVTNPDNYSSSLACFNDNGAGAGGVANDGIKNGTEPTVSTGTHDSVVVAKGDHIICTYTNTRKQGTIVITKITKPAATPTSFQFQTSPNPPYSGFSLLTGNSNSQTLDTGTYTVKELVPLGWVLTGIGMDPADQNHPFNCAVSGTGGSTGLGDLNTQTATISLKGGDTITCVFENTGQGVTRTQGFWATHLRLSDIAWFGGTNYGHTFLGVAAVAGIGDASICGRPIDTDGKLMGAFWSSVSTKSTGAKRSSLDQAKMQLLQQLVAAELNAVAFGSVPSSGSFAAWETALCGTDLNAIKTAQQQAASFNSQGDSSTFTPGTSADSKTARSVANLAFWDVFS
jgi:hypothetical protein